MIKSSPEKRAEKLKDRQAYRQTLINRLHEMEVKLSKVEEQIADLRK
jgi:hypothetical protein